MHALGAPSLLQQTGSHRVSSSSRLPAASPCPRHPQQCSAHAASHAASEPPTAASAQPKRRSRRVSASTSSSSVAHQQHAGIPPAEVWEQELRHLQGLMVDPHKPLLRQFVLQQCYQLNGSSTQAQFRQLSAAALGKIAADRQRLEVRLSRAVNALCAAWRRLQLLQQAVLEQGAAFDEQQLAKERELVVGLRDRLQQAQRLYNRTVSRATELGDTAYVTRSRPLNSLLQQAAAAAEAYLSHGLANIAAASRVNTVFRNAWSKAPQAQRPSPALAEAQRQAQLSPLLPLLPEEPEQLLASYQRVAMAFQLHTDASLQQRAPSHGLPSSAGAVFWQQDSSLPGEVQTAGQAGAEPDDGSLATQQQQQQAPIGPAAPPPLQTGEAAWQQPPQQLLARPAQQLPLLPHLARPWVKQATLRFQQQQQQAGGAVAISAADTQNSSSHGHPASSQPVLPQRSRVVSLSGKVLPPLPVLLQRALEVEQQLVRKQQQAEGS